MKPLYMGPSLFTYPVVCCSGQNAAFYILLSQIDWVKLKLKSMVGYRQLLSKIYILDVTILLAIKPLAHVLLVYSPSVNLMSPWGLNLNFILTV